jgi:hypothetical protein
MVTGVTTLTGSDCPVHGQAATFREHGLVFNLFPFTLVAQGSWQAQIDLNNNGTVDASVNGTVTLFGPSFLGQFEQIAGAEGPTFEMGLDQLAAIDFTSPHHQPLVSLDTLQGGIGGFIHVGH